MAVLLGYAGLLGLILGSFGNVVVHRVPLGLSLIRPSSRCPACEHPIRHRHNVPVVGWLVLRGGCADCGARIGARYPLVELGTGVLFVALTMRLAGLDMLPALPAYLYLGATGVVLALIDLDHRRLPNAIVLSSYPVVLVLLAAASTWRQDWTDLERALLGGAALFAFYLLIALVYPAGMGVGDVKLSGLLGVALAYLSWGTLLVGAFAGFLLGSLAGIALIASRRGTRRTTVPFGPFMIAGAMLAVFVGEAVAAWYLRL